MRIGVLPNWLYFNLLPAFPVISASQAKSRPQTLLRMEPACRLWFTGLYLPKAIIAFGRVSGNECQGIVIFAG